MISYLRLPGWPPPGEEGDGLREAAQPGAHSSVAGEDIHGEGSALLLLDGLLLALLGLVRGVRGRRWKRVVLFFLSLSFPPCFVSKRSRRDR